MRITLDTSRAIVETSLGHIDPAAPVTVRLGDSALDVQIHGGNLAPLMDGATPPVLVAPARLEFTAKPLDAGIADIDAAAAVSGAVEVNATPSATAAQVVTCGEDWKNATLVALIGVIKESLSLRGQFRWRNGAAPTAGWRYSSLFNIKVLNSLFPDVLVPGAALVAGNEFYFKSVNAYIGTATALEAIKGAALSDLDLVRVVIPTGGLDIESSWRVHKPATELTNVPEGVIALLDGTAHLSRVSGL